MSREEKPSIPPEHKSRSPLMQKAETKRNPGIGSSLVRILPDGPSDDPRKVQRHQQYVG